ncbi:MAG: energy-coupling factor transporter ATPase [Desulfatiglandaceae bacterium]
MPSSLDHPIGVDQKPPLFSMKRLYYTYPNGIQAVSGIGLNISSGESIALVGQNGSGKTTLIKLLSGLLKPEKGTVRYKGEPLSDPYLSRVRPEIGVLFQDPDDQLFGHTVLEDVAFGLRSQGVSQADAVPAATDALAQVSLKNMAYKPPHRLSFGQKKRAALAGLLVTQPEVLLLDEPTANLDPGQEQVFLDLLKAFPGTLVTISHDLIFLYELCDRAIVLDQGCIHRDCALCELVSQRDNLRAHGLDFSFRMFVTKDGLESDADSPDKCPRTARSPMISPDDAPLVVLRDYAYRYPDGTPALKDIDLAIHERERVAVVGENGAGKTTLLSCLIGLCQGQGEFLFDGCPVTWPVRRRLWRDVGMVFQDCADQLFCSSVAEELGFGLRQLGCSRNESRSRIQQALSLVQLEGFEDRVPLHLSGGERKRLALASVLAMKPRLLILDEPTAGLDPQGEELLLHILKDLQVTLLLVSHDIFFINELTDRTLVMHRGEIIKDLWTHAFSKDERLGNLNGLSFVYRERSAAAISLLQYEHEHRHIHEHPHIHTHRHDRTTHVHHHEHAHTHRFLHRHPGDDKAHDHLAWPYHTNDHPMHEDDADDHAHKKG